MKKTIILILAVLPIFLLITIDFAGRIIQEYMHIAVEKVCFVDSKLAEYDKGEIFKADLGDPKKVVQELIVKIEPARASNKKITLSSSDNTVCTVEQVSADDEKGTVTCKVTSLKVGYADITVISQENNLITTNIKMRVTDDDVKGITLEPSEMDLIIGEPYKLTPTVLSPDALDKLVWYESSDPTTVKVDANGNVTALKEGTAIITAKTNDGEFTATCTIHAVKGQPALAFDFSGTTDVTPLGAGYYIHVDTIDLSDYLQVDENRVDITNVRFKVNDPGEFTIGTPEDETMGIITFDTARSRTLKVIVYVGDVNKPDYQIELLIRYVKP